MTQDHDLNGIDNHSTAGRMRNGMLGGATALAGLGLGIASYAAFREPLRVQMERLTLRVPNAQGRLPRHGLRVLHLSDTHFRGANWRESPKIHQIREMTASIDYDILVHTGDFLHNDEGLANILALMDLLPKAHLGAFAVLGNHDYMQYSAREMFGRGWSNFNEEMDGASGNGYLNNPLRRLSRLLAFGRYFANTPLDLRHTGTNDTTELIRELEARDVQVLRNRNMRLQHVADNGEPVDLYIAGIDDLTEGKPDLRGALAGIPCDAPTLLLSHNPDILVDSDIRQADVVLAGHTHGGQIVLPWLGAAHTHSEHLGRREASGYLRRGGTQIYISRGIGEGIPLRFAAAPQIVLITLLPS